MHHLRPALIRAAALAVAALLLAGCSGESGSSPLPGGLRQAEGGLSPIQRTTCRDWERGTVDQRLATIDQLEEVIGKRTPAGSGPRLPAKVAYDLLERACSNEFTQGMELFKLYGRAAAFRSRLPEAAAAARSEAD